MITEVFIEGNKLELFDDETISITQGVQDVKDISKLFADFSQSFSVPASKTNNLIFKNYYNQDIDNGFDARTRKDAIININTIPFKTGKIQLNSVEIKENKPASYNITFYGDVIKVKDLIGDDKLNTLDWLNNFNHDYTPSNIKDALIQGLDFTVDSVLYEKAVIYPLISYRRQYFYNSDPSNTTATETLVNIAYNAGRTDAIRFNELKPAIKLYLIVDAIEQKYGINFVGGFFESDNFKQIYVNLNKETKILSQGFLEFENIDINLPIIDGIAISSVLDYTVTITPNSGFTTVPYKIKFKRNDTLIYESPFFTETNVFNAVFSAPVGVTNIKAEIITQSDFEFTANTVGNHEYISPAGIPQSNNLFNNTYTNQVIDINTIITDQLKDIKTYDFLTGLFKTFNLTVSPLNGDILVEDLQTWYTNGNIIDVTPYIDTKKKTVDKGVIYNKLDFKFEESDQIIADEFNQSNNRVYGNDDLTLYTDATETEKLDGETLEIESIFENPIHERLLDTNTGDYTTIQYCPYFNRSVQSISGQPFMFYSKPVSVSSNPIGYVDATTYSQINTTVMMPSHSKDIDFDSFTLNFSAEINEYTREVGFNNIYSTYYQNYVSDIFSVKRRNYKFEGILPLSILNSLKLNDRLIIRNTRYIINKITSNLTKRKDTLELINDIYNAPLASDVLNTSLFTPSFLRFGSSANTGSTQYVGIENANVKKKDTGYDTAWVTINSFGTGKTSTLSFSIDANNTGVDRTVILEVLDGINNPKFLIIQESGAIKADTTLITADTNLITADNG